MTRRVVILGGGVAGMSAAHELIERDFDVKVFERRVVAGGKARSIPAKGRNIAGLPGEHGFRFFPGFYRHLPDTMSRIPFGRQRNGVAANLVSTTDSELATKGKPPTIVPAHFPSTLQQLWKARHFFDFLRFGVTMADMAYFMDRLFILQASCEARRYEQWEYESWWDFSGASGRSPQYQQYLADGMTRKLVAARAREASARTMGYTTLQLLHNLTTPGATTDRLLNGPTSEVWIDPWLDHLRRRGVTYETNAKVLKFECHAGRVSSVTIQRGRNQQRVSADYYVAAVPVEVMKCLVEASPELENLDPRLGELRSLRTRWMNGIQFYLRHDVPLACGHTIYGDSPWSLTSVSQQQFWPTTPLAAMGNGACQGVLSVDISDWTTPGWLYGKPAGDCTTDEIKKEVWHQLKLHLNVGGKVVLDDANLLGSFLDPDIVPPNPRTKATVNLEPLLVNTCGSWYSRPEASTGIENLFLASDYVRTFTDLATMEGANEAARRAVNAILDVSGSERRRCAVWPLREPVALAPLRALDALRFRRRIPPGPCPPVDVETLEESVDCKDVLGDEQAAADSDAMSAAASAPPDAS
jgi:15-cis-phytoene desaturase